MEYFAASKIVDQVIFELNSGQRVVKCSRFVFPINLGEIYLPTKQGSIDVEMNIVFVTLVKTNGIWYLESYNY